MANRKQNKANKKKKDSKIIDQKSPENAKQLMSGREAQQDNKVGSEEDEKCGFVERFMSRFGYVKKNAVMTYLIGINKQLDNNMDEDNFAKMPLKDQFAEVVNQIKTDTEVVDEVTGNNVVTPVGISESDEIAKTEEETAILFKEDPELEKLRDKNNELSVIDDNKEDNLKDKNEDETVHVSEQTNTAETDKSDEKTDTEVVKDGYRSG